MSSIIERKKVGLHAKCASLQADFTYWTDLLSNGMGLHTTQLQCLVDGKVGALSSLCQALTTAAGRMDELPAEKVPDAARALEEMLLATHCLWGFFREKLAQRLDAAARPFLNAADELAWECYHRAAEAANVRNVPPLVFLNGGLSPFMVPRGARWNAEGVPGDLLTSGEFTAVLDSLPLPIIGVPYAQVTYLPDLIFVAHEAGHAVESDCQLTAELQAALTESLGGEHPRLARWKGWLGECFADAWAVANTGPAYVGALQDFLAAGQDRGGSDRYPPTCLRVRLGRKMLETTGFEEDARNLLAQWREVASNDDADVADDDLPSVATALLVRPLKPLGGQNLRKLGGYDTGQHQAAATAAASARSGEAIQGNDARVLVAALRQSYTEKPDVFDVPEISSGKIVRKSRSMRFQERMQPTASTRRSEVAVEWDNPELYDTLKKILAKRGRAEGL